MRAGGPDTKSYGLGAVGFPTLRVGRVANGVTTKENHYQCRGKVFLFRDVEVRLVISS
jgi:hypothetical protein